MGTITFSCRIKKPRQIALAALTGVMSLLGNQATLQAENGLQRGDLVAICGDYITFEGKYSVYVQDYLLMCKPQTDLQVLQFGRGEKVSAFPPRQNFICNTFRPSVATICHGMDDACYVAATPSASTFHLQSYKNSITNMVMNFKNAGVHSIVVGSPWVVDPYSYRQSDPTNCNKSIGVFAEAAKQVAMEQGVTFADVHGIMADVMVKAKAKYGKEYVFANEYGLSPGPNGHLVMAYAFLKALGCDGNIGTITVDLKNNTATATDGHKILSLADGNVGVESTRYPFCFYGDPDKQTTRSIIEFFPFNEDLNRYRLVVKNATTPKLKVTWGKTAKVYAATDLENGINLAAEFIDNPFSEPFKKGDSRMRTQQGFERTAKALCDSLVEWRKLAPELADRYDKMEQAVVEKIKTEAALSSTAVVPVKHTIKIEPAAL